MAIEIVSFPINSLVIFPLSYGIYPWFSWGNHPISSGYFGTGPQRPRPAACAQLPGAPARLAPGATAAAAARRQPRRGAGADVVSGGGRGAAGGGDPKGRWRQRMGRVIGNSPENTTEIVPKMVTGD